MDKKNIFIELPTWLGDAIMTSPAIHNILNEYPNANITLFGSFVSIEAFKNYPNITQCIVDKSKVSSFRYYYLFTLAKSLKHFDIALSFRRTISSKIFMFFIKATSKANYKRYDQEKTIHQVVRYNTFVNKTINIKTKAYDLKLYYTPKIYSKPTLGINPGATYGSAKRWYPERFAGVANQLADQYDIIIFGGPNEIDIANDIEKNIEKKVMNLAGKTSIPELIENIAGLSLFITGDSGPMHIASAYKIKTIAIFGPTNDAETAQWRNPNSYIVKNNLSCAPCMKRVCPLRTHECMLNISEYDILNKIKQII